MDATTSGLERKHGLDMLRMLLALAVVVYHYLFFGLKDGFHAPEWADHLLWLRFAVSIFFVLSGYVIYYSMSGRNTVGFLAARARRLRPALAICGTLTMGIAWALGTLRASDPAHWLHAITLLPLIMHGDYLDSSYWSLTFELRFYALVALVLAIGLRHHAVWVVTGLGLLGCVERSLGLHGPGAFLFSATGLFGLGMALAWSTSARPMQAVVAVLANL